MTNVLSPVRDQLPLVGVVARDSSDLLDNIRQARRYGTTVTSVSVVAHMPDVDNKVIVYAISRRNTSLSLDFLATADVEKVQQPVTLSDAYHDDLAASIRRYLDVTPDFRKVDLAGPLARLAAGLALYSVTGSLTGNQLRGGLPLRIHAMDARTQALPQENVVFIPTLVEFIDAPAALYALACAVNGEGAAVCSNCVWINQNNAPQMTNYIVDSSLASGMVSAIRIICSMYSGSDASAIAGTAIAKGIHAVLSVHGHTDEGAYMRDVLRHGWYDTPYGGVYLSAVEAYQYIPTFMLGDMAATQAWVDGVALKTAGCVGLADPLVEYNGRMFPTTYSWGGGKEIPGADVADANQEEDQRLRQLICRASGKFTRNYVTLLGGLVGGTPGGVSRASSVIVNGLSILSAMPQANRHIRQKTVAPWYWVEPTSLFKVRDTSVATSNGHGVVVGTSEMTNEPAFNDLQFFGAVGLKEVGVVEFMSPRTTPGIRHLYNHREDGLAHITILEAEATYFSLPGRGMIVDNPLPGNSVEDGIMEQASLDAFFWRHGICQGARRKRRKHGICQLPSPAECNYLGGEVKISATTTLEEGMELLPTHTYSLRTAAMDMPEVKTTVRVPMALAAARPQVDC